MNTKKNRAHPLIELRDITKTFVNGDIESRILLGITATIYKGEFVAIVGPSGSGKSTLMNIIGLLDRATGGKYVLDGDDVTDLTENEQAYMRNKKIGFIFQSFNLLNRASALENVVLPSIYAGMKKRDREERAKDLLTLVGLSDRMGNRPSQLSGGQQQRVAIARSLMNNPELLLADEPTGNLDSKSGEDVMTIFKELHNQGHTIVMITHDPDRAKEADRRILIKDGVIV